MTTFVDNSTVIQAVWLNSVDRAVTQAIGTGTSAPTTPTEVKVNLGLDQVNNTSDANKPISLATQTALNTKQNNLPMQTGHVGKYLQTNGLDISWTSVNSNSVGFLQAGTGAVTRTAQDKMRESVSVLDFGAIGDGVTDDTINIQKALDYAASTKQQLTGGGLTYRVSTVKPKTGQRIKQLYLESIGPLSGGAVYFQPVIEIDGTVSAKSNMVFEDVRANGRRDLFTNIDMNGGGGGEDGGMHAWRVAATAMGGVSDITWVDCQGINAGTAGLAIHGTTPTVGTSDYPIKNLNWTGGKLTGNREHGWFADAFDGLTVINVDCRGNGLDLNTSDALTHGNRGARSGGYLLGSAFDAESYTGYNGSLWKNLIVNNVDARGCAMPALLYNPIASNVSGYQPHSGINISGNKFDAGLASGGDRSPSTDYSFNVYGNRSGAAYPYVGIIMEGNLFDTFPPKFTSVQGLSVTGGYINAASKKAIVIDCKWWDISANSQSTLLDITPAITPTFTKTQGTAGATISAQSTIRTVCNAGGELVVHVSGTITGAVTADGDLIYSCSSPVSGMIITELSCSAWNTAGVATPTTSLIDIGGTATFTIDTLTSGSIYFSVFMRLRAAG